MSVIGKILKDPLAHFLVAGILLFVVYSFFNPGNDDSDDQKSIIVDKGALLNFIQYRAKAFDTKRFETILANMSKIELQRLIDEYVREEVLYREAIGLELGKDDYIIRRRMTQKVEFITRGFTEASLKLSDGDIRKYYLDNKNNYAIAPHVTFTHVFYESERRGHEQALLLAKAKLQELNELQVAFADAPKHGDRFYYHLNYVERTSDYVTSHLGPQAASNIFELEPSDTKWRGPYKSPYGYHLVMLTKTVKRRIPKLVEIRNRVSEDAKRAQINRNVDQAIGKIIKNYNVKIIYEQGKDNKAAGMAKK